MRDAYVISMDDERRVYPNGAIAISGTRIVGVGRNDELVAAFAPRRVISAGGGTVHPGFVECHMHVSVLIWRWAFVDTVDWSQYMACHVAFYRALRDEEEYASTRLACLEMAMNGTTCYLESGTVLTTDAAAQGTEEIGIRGVLADAMVHDRDPEPLGLTRAASHSIDQLGGELDRNLDPDGLVRGHIALRGLASASEELLLAAKRVADEHGVTFSQHQSFAELDTGDDDRRFGGHVMAHLADAGVLGPNCTWSHVNAVRDDEVAPIVESGMSIAWCPTASMLLGVGGTQRGRHAELYRAGSPITLGSDSANSCGRHDLADQAYIALLTARDKTRGRALDAEDALEMLTRNGARAVGLGDEIGSLEVGKRADLVLHRMDVPEALPGIDRIRQLVFSQRSRTVDTVIVNGRVVLEGGQATRVDAAEIYARAREASKRMSERIDTTEGLAVRHRWPQLV